MVARVRRDAVVEAGRLLRAGWQQRAVAAEVGIGLSTLQRYLSNDDVFVLKERKRRSNALDLSQREEIRVGVERGEADAVIAARIGCHRSTVWREIRAGGGRRAYRAVRAQNAADERARRPKPGWTVQRPHVWAMVQEWMRQNQSSPQQIARELRCRFPDQSEWWVSHEAIYQAIFVQAKPELRKELAACLRSGRAQRHQHGRASRGGGRIVGMVNISERPAEADDRAVPGHWEGDLIIGQGAHSAVASLVERSTRFGMLIKIDTKNAVHVAERIAAHLTTLPAQLQRSLTWDQGSELAEHATFSVATGIPVFFCDPHSPWQRGTNENWNGLARQYLPKGTDLSGVTQEQLDDYANRLNTRRRMTLEWDTPSQRFARLVATTT